MIPWQILESVPVPGGGGQLSLHRRGSEFSIRVAGRELMNSRVHGSEDALAELTCARLSRQPSPKVLIGGLGMGFTAAAALSALGGQARVVVAELVPAVVSWNQGPLAALAGYPLQDPRLTMKTMDVALLLQGAASSYDGIILDVDNGPDGLTRSGNDWLYGHSGIRVAHMALRPEGILAVWSAAPDPSFGRRLRQGGFVVEECTVRARGKKGGGRHVIWLARK